MPLDFSLLYSALVNGILSAVIAAPLALLFLMVVVYASPAIRVMTVAILVALAFCPLTSIWHKMAPVPSVFSLSTIAACAASILPWMTLVIWYGYRQLSRSFLDLCPVFGLSRHQIIMWLEIPALLPHTGIALAFGTAQAILANSLSVTRNGYMNADILAMIAVFCGIPSVMIIMHILFASKRQNAP